MSRIEVFAEGSPRINFHRSNGALRFNEGQTRISTQAASHAMRRSKNVHSIVESRLSMTIIGENAEAICEISLLTSEVFNQITAVKTKHARRDASKASDSQATTTHMLTT